MRKVSILLIVVTFGLLISTPLRAQIYIADVYGTCKNWSEEIYEIVSEKNHDGNISVTIDYCESVRVRECVEISWNKKIFTVDNVSFNLATKEFVKHGKTFETDHLYFTKLEAVRSYVYKAYKKGIYSPDYKE